MECEYHVYLFVNTVTCNDWWRMAAAEPETISLKV